MPIENLTRLINIAKMQNVTPIEPQKMYCHIGSIICTTCSYKEGKMKHFEVDLESIEDKLRLCDEDFQITEKCPKCGSAHSVTLNESGKFIAQNKPKYA